MIGGVSAIVPLVDLFNHQQEKYSISHGEKERGILKRANVLAIETDKLDFQIKAFSEIQQNEEVKTRKDKKNLRKNQIVTFILDVHLVWKQIKFRAFISLWICVPEK